MSPRDLPVWARGAAAALVLTAAWHVPRTEPLVTVVGYSSLEISAGVVAAAILAGMGLPLSLWPDHPRREVFSLRVALIVAVVMGVLMVASRPSDLAGQLDPGLILVVILGAVAWSLSWGQVHHRAFLRWYGIAAAAAITPVVIGVLSIAIQDGGLPNLRLGSFLAAVPFFLIVGAAGALVTQELAFRRVLIGQAGDAGLATVLLAALLFGSWHALAPDPPGGVVQAAMLASLHGVVLGSMYSMSRSLLVPALYHGVWLAAFRGIGAAAEMAEGAPAFEGGMTAVLVTTGGIALFFAYLVSRRSGFVGVLARRH